MGNDSANLRHAREYKDIYIAKNDAWGEGSDMLGELEFGTTPRDANSGGNINGKEITTHREGAKMKPKMRIVLIAEDRLSIGRWLIIIAIFGLLLASSATLIPDALNGKIYHYSKQTWGYTLFGIGFFIFMIIIGIIAHRVVKWPVFINELYPDGWIRYILKKGDFVSIDSYIPPNLLVRISKYKKKYSKRRKMWYIWLNFDFLYENKVYTAVTYGWLSEPKDIKEFEKYIEFIRNKIKETTKGKEIKITFSMTGSCMDDWSELEYAQKIKEERDKLIGEDSGDS